MTTMFKYLNRIWTEGIWNISILIRINGYFTTAVSIYGSPWIVMNHLRKEFLKPNYVVTLLCIPLLR